MAAFRAFRLERFSALLPAMVRSYVRSRIIRQEPAYRSIPAGDEALGDTHVVAIVRAEGAEQRGFFYMDSVDDGERGRDEDDRQAGPVVAVQAGGDKDHLHAE